MIQHKHLTLITIEFTVRGTTENRFLGKPQDFSKNVSFAILHPSFPDFDGKFPFINK